uniref:UNC93-like protein n=1 Tax=Caenorhabditis tropicalis TaxID=1561998 RepID=A0A1I7TFK3_9PELO
MVHKKLLILKLNISFYRSLYIFLGYCQSTLLSTQLPEDALKDSIDGQSDIPITVQVAMFGVSFILFPFIKLFSNFSVGISFIDINFYAGQVLPILMCFMYGVMIADIYWKKSQNNGKSKKFSAFDIKLAFQYLLVCSVQYLASFLFYIVPKVGNGSVLAIISMNIIGLYHMTFLFSFVYSQVS